MVIKYWESCAKNSFRLYGCVSVKSLLPLSIDSQGQTAFPNILLYLLNAFSTIGDMTHKM